MINVIVIGILIALVYLFFKAKYVQHKLYSVIIIAFLLFFYVSGARVVSENEVNLSTFDGVVTAVRLYFGWLGHVFTNTKVIVGNAFKMNWAGNSTIK